MSQPAEFHFTGTQGDQVQAWILKPVGWEAGKKYPVAFVIHGGPHTAPGDNWHYRWNNPLFAAQGYVVCSVNYHGSSSFGHAFLDSITHRWGELELQDIEAATDWVLKQPWADRKRVFASGDVRFSPVKRVAAAVGEGSMAIAFVHQYLREASAGRG